MNQLDQSERRSTLRVAAIRGDEIHYAGGTVGDFVGNFSRVARSGGKVDTFNPSNHFYLFPMKAGASWNLESVQNTGDRIYDLRVRLAVVAEEEVETAVGKMRTLRIVRESHWKQRDSENAGTSTWTYWYNAGVKRFVLAEASSVTTKGKVLLRERYELASYEVK